MNKQILKNFKVVKEIHGQTGIQHLILPAHFILSLYYIYSNESGSRYSLSEILGIPMSRIRKILTILENKKLIEKNLGRKGSRLTKEGIIFCEMLFSYFKIINPAESIDLGPIVLGKINSLTMMPKIFFTKKINSITIRDTSMKCGALGATVFESKINDNKILQVNFLDDESMVEGPLADIIKEFSFDTKDQLIIASTINDLPEYYFNPLFDRTKSSAFKIALVASVQSMWELVNQELD